MMKIVGFGVCIIAVGIAGYGCKPKPTVRNIPVTNFTKIVIKSGNVVWRQGNVPYCEVVGVEDKVTRMSAEVVGDTLVVSTATGLANKNGTHLNIKSSNLEDISVEGMSYLDAMGIKADKLSVQTEGLGEVRLFGTAKSLDLIMEGSNEFDSIKLNAENVKVNIDGVCTAHVFASKSLDVKAKDVSKVYYKGNPPKVTQQADKMCKVEPM